MKKKILIVDDEEDVLEVLEKRLSEKGYAVIKALAGEKALEMARSHQPDLIILDVMMPDLDGGEVADILQKDPATKNIPVMFLTCLLTKEEEKGRRIISGRYFLAKPYKPDELIKVIREQVEPK